MTPAWPLQRDFSDAVDAEIGTSDLDSIEGNLVLWLDAENINGENNAGLTDNQAIDRWDMSGNGNNVAKSRRFTCMIKQRKPLI